MPKVKRVGAGGINKIKQLDDRVEKLEKQVTEHKIYSDGTYSNAPVNTVVDDIRAGQVRKFVIGTATHRQLCRVVALDQFGVYTEPANGPNLDRSECSFWKWAELEEEVIKPI